MLDKYRNRYNYDVFKDYENIYHQMLLKRYKYEHLLAAGIIDRKSYDEAFKPKDYLSCEKESNGLDVAQDVMDTYGVSLEQEKEQILLTAKNVDYLRNVNDNYIYCRNTCKIVDQRLRNYNNYPSEYQRCFTDCLNIRTELFNKVKPGNEEEKKRTFVWMA